MIDDNLVPHNSFCGRADIQFGQVAKLGAVAKEIRTHRNRYVYRNLVLTACFEQQLDEGARFIRGGLFRVAKKFFKLVDKDQQAETVVIGALP